MCVCVCVCVSVYVCDRVHASSLTLSAPLHHEANVLGMAFKHMEGNVGKIFDVDGWDNRLGVAVDGKGGRLHLPRHAKERVEGVFPAAVVEARAHNKRVELAFGLLATLGNELLCINLRLEMLVCASLAIVSFLECCFLVLLSMRQCMVVCACVCVSIPLPLTQ